MGVEQSKLTSKQRREYSHVLKKLNALDSACESFFRKDSKRTRQTFGEAFEAALPLLPTIYRYLLALPPSQQTDLTVSLDKFFYSLRYIQFYEIPTSISTEILAYSSAPLITQAIRNQDNAQLRLNSFRVAKRLIKLEPTVLPYFIDSGLISTLCDTFVDSERCIHPYLPDRLMKLYNHLHRHPFESHLFREAFISCGGDDIFTACLFCARERLRMSYSHFEDCLNSNNMNPVVP
ncbi:hypothetical protein BLNAU_11619 [Blattamonas nauphoetae]|uniref:Uncharacterized protein n=1 Tax=Blattamonas nauphoetae TaxID=2049346 RepID=A0ABQ9XRD1_9EUKA|nr:hypothetical protein BLNAU_11619 [Blattamonas nauphoetae]